MLPDDLQILYDSIFKTKGLAARLITEDETTPSDQEDPESCRSLPSPTQREIALPADLQILYDSIFKTETGGSVVKLITEDATVPSDQEDPEEILPHDVFIDPIADYMELLLDASSLAYFLIENQIHQQQPFYATTLIMGAHDRIMLRSSKTISQRVHFFSVA